MRSGPLDIALNIKYHGAMKKAKMGRPPIPAAQARSKLVGVRFTKAERRELEAKARACGLTVTGFLRQKGGFNP